MPANHTMADILFWGAKGQAKVLREALPASDWKLVALIDGHVRSSPWPDIPVLPGEEGLDHWLARRSGAAQHLYAAVAVGRNDGSRIILMDRLEQRGITIATIVHRRAFVAGDAEIGVGVQILAQSSVCSGVRLGRGVIVNTAASVDHDCVLEDGVHVAPGARLAGEVHVASHAFIGTGAVVLPRCRIGANAVVGAGAVVTRDVPAGETVVGNPARPLVL